MKKTIVKTDTPGMAGPSRICKSNRSVDEGFLPLREYLTQPDIEAKDPLQIIGYIAQFPHEDVAPEMLAWYRSGDLWKVTMASAYYHHSDVSRVIEELIEQIQSGDREIAQSAKQRLPKFGEFALRKALKLLSGPSLHAVIREIFSRMEGRVIPLVLKSLRNEAFAARMAVAESLSSRRNHHALPVLLDLLCEVEPETQTWAPEANSVPPWVQFVARPALN